MAPVAVHAGVVTVIVVLAPRVSDLGLKVATAFVGNPAAEKVTALGKVPSSGAVEITNTADSPAAMVCVFVALDTSKSAISNVRAFEVVPESIC